MVVMEGEGVMELAPQGKGNIYAPVVTWDGRDTFSSPSLSRWTIARIIMT
jgi:hypothetical protein